MAVSPRLARKFQQTLGSEAAEDLVSWMDQLDSQGEDVRVLIARIGEWREASRADLAELRQEMHAVRQEMQTGFASIRQDLKDSVGELKLADAQLRTDLANVRADLLKWSFGFWVAAVGAFALLR